MSSPQHIKRDFKNIENYNKEKVSLPLNLLEGSIPALRAHHGFASKSASLSSSSGLQVQRLS